MTEHEAFEILIEQGIKYCHILGSSCYERLLLSGEGDWRNTASYSDRETAIETMMREAEEFLAEGEEALIVLDDAIGFYHVKGPPFPLAICPEIVGGETYLISHGSPCPACGGQHDVRNHDVYETVPDLPDLDPPPPPPGRRFPLTETEYEEEKPS